MCKDCGCSVTEVPEKFGNNVKTVEIFEKILKNNDSQAASNREHFDKYGIYSINIMGSPGSGKTTLLEKTIELLKDELNIGVIEGDLETNKDAERIRKKGASAYQITTGTACHLDAFMVHKGIHNLPLNNLDFVFVENVGNLVCPASYDLGTHENIILLSIPEGDDKPAKYPVMFRSADVLIITKIDLLSFFDFDVEQAVNEVKKLNPKVKIFYISTKTGEGIDRWTQYLREKKEVMKS
ncbi:hydrogenase nickel incorporation protein HypB [Persephonella sp.]